MHALPRTFVTPTMALVVVVAFAGGALAQPAPPDFSKVQIKTTKISGNFYTLEGQGASSACHMDWGHINHLKCIQVFKTKMSPWKLRPIDTPLR
jgi:hypothetical protein